MAIQLRADDVMPWGKYAGETLRTVYEMDDNYYEYLYLNQKACEISEETHLGLECNSLAEDKSVITASCNSYYWATEYGVFDVVNWGIHKGETLLEIFLANESYFRFIVSSPNYYISQATVNQFVNDIIIVDHFKLK